MLIEPKTYSNLFIPLSDLCSGILSGLKIDRFGLIRFLNNKQYISCGNYPLDYINEYLSKVSTPHPKVIEAISNAHLFNKGKMAWLGGEENDGNIISKISKKYGLGSRLVIVVKDNIGFYLFYFVMQISLGDRTKFLLENYDLLYDVCSIIKIRSELLFKRVSPLEYSSFKDFSLSDHIYNREISNKQSQMIKIREKLSLHHKQINPKMYNLSSRELECINGIAKGKSYKEIGYDLNISYRTVETHINHIKEKTGLHYKSELRNLFYDPYNTSINNLRERR